MCVERVKKRCSVVCNKNIESWMQERRAHVLSFRKGAEPVQEIASPVVETKTPEPPKAQEQKVATTQELQTKLPEKSQEPEKIKEQVSDRPENPIGKKEGIPSSKPCKSM